MREKTLSPETSSSFFPVVKGCTILCRMFITFSLESGYYFPKQVISFWRCFTLVFSIPKNAPMARYILGDAIKVYANIFNLSFNTQELIY